MPPVLLCCPDPDCAAVVQAPRLGETAETLLCPRCRRPLQQGQPTADVKSGPHLMLRCPSTGCGVIVKASVRPGESLVCPLCRAALAAVARPAPSSETRSSAPVAQLAPQPQNATLALSETSPFQTPGAPSLPPVAAVPIAPQTIGRFSIQRFLGEGGFGRVYEAYDPSLKRQVALKVARPEQMQTPDRVERFMREARSAGRLMHPHIVTVFDSGQDGPHHYIASAFVPGRSLDRVLREHDKGLDVQTAVTIVRKLAEALAYAHREGIVHRDVKPANVMLREDGEPMLMDFGLAARQEAGEERLTQGRVPMGTPSFMAPEQWQGEAVAASDQYSLGVSLFELLTGDVPFSGNSAAHLMILHETQPPPSPRLRRPNVPRDLEAICLRCLEKEPSKRYPDCQALADDLKRWLDGETVTARLPGPVERLRKWARRRPAVAGLTAAVVFVTALGFVLVTVAWARALKKAADEAVAKQNETTAREAAEIAQANEEEQRKLAERSADAARAQAIRLITDNGARHALEADVLGALPWFAGALRDDVRTGDVNKVHRLRVSAFMRYSPRLVQTFILEGPARHAAFSPDGKRLVAVATAPDEQFRVWDVATGSPVTPPLNPDSYGSSPSYAAFSADGQRLLTVVVSAFPFGQQSTMQLWDVATGKRLTDPVKLPRYVSHAAFASAGDRIVTTARNPFGEVGEARLWDGKTLRAICLLNHQGGVKHADFDAKGERVVTAGQDGVAAIWNAGSGERMEDLKHGSPLRHARFSPDGQLVVTAAENGTARVWDVATKKEIGQPLVHGGRINQASFSADGKRLVTASSDGTAQVWRTATGLRLGLPLTHRGTIHLASFSADGTRVLTAGDDRTVRLWDPEAVGDGPVALIRLNGTLTQAAFSPDGTHVLTASEDRTVRVWQTATPGPTTHPSNGSETVLFVGPDGKRLLLADAKQNVQVWDTTKNEALTPLLEHPHKVDWGTLNAQGTHALTRCGPDGKTEIRLWNLADRTAQVLAHPGTVKAICFSPDGRLAVTAGVLGPDALEAALFLSERKGEARIWDVRTGKMIGQPIPERGGFDLVRFSLDNRRLVVATLDYTFGTPKGAARVWDVETRAALTPPLTIDGFVGCLAISPDGQYVAAGTMGAPGQVRVWETSPSGKIVGRFAHAGTVHHVGFSPNSKRLVSASADGTARVWDVEGKPLSPP